VFAEAGVDQGLQHLQQCLLDESVQHRRNTQLALASVRFRDHHFAYRTGPVPACQQLLADVWPALADHLGGLLDIVPIDPGCAFVGIDLFPSGLQVLPRQRRFQQVTCARFRLCRPCALVFKKRAAGFVADGITRGFTASCTCPPGLLQHLTHGL